MTTTLTAPRSAPTLTGSPGVPFGRLLKTELRKLTDTRAGKWLLLAIVTITPMVVVVALFAAKPKNLTYHDLVNYTQTPQKLLLPILGILAITSEWSQRTGLVTFTLAPNRGRVILAKITATIGLGLVVIAAAFGAAAIANLLGSTLRGGNGSWAFGLSGFRDIVVVQLTGLLQGLGVGMVVLVSAAAVVAYYLIPDLWSFLFSGLGSLKQVAPWVDLNKAQTPLYQHDITGRGWIQLLVAVSIWVGVPLVFGVLRVRRSEVKSA